MRRWLVCVSVFKCISAGCQAQLLQSPVASAYANTGIGSRRHIDVFTVTANPAVLAQLQHTSVALYHERRFLLNELANTILAAGFATSSGNFGIIIRHAGFSAYSESQASLLHARRVGTKMDAGVQFNYTTTRVGSYGSSAAIGFELASSWQLSEKMQAGVHIGNYFSPGKQNVERQPFRYTTNWGYEASEKFFVGVTVNKEQYQPVDVQVALQYKLGSIWIARTGISSATSSMWAGAGLCWKRSRLDFVTGYHPQLGITPGIVLFFSVDKKVSQL